MLIKQFKIIPLLATLFLTLLCATGISHGQNNGLDFDVTWANEQIERISKLAISAGDDLSLLEKSIEELDQLKAKGKQCVDYTQSKLDTINELISAMPKDEAIKKLRPDYAYLEKEKTTFESKNGECRALVFRIDDVLVGMKDTMQQSTTSHLLSRSVPIWQVLTGDVTLEMPVFTEIKKSDDEQQLLESVNHSLLITILIFSIIISIAINYFIKKILAREQEHNRFALAILSNLRLYCLPLLLVLSIYIYFRFFLLPDHSGTMQFIIMLTYFLLAIFTIHTVFNPFKPAVNPLLIPQNFGRSLFIKSSILLTYLMLGYLTTMFVDLSKLNTEILEISRTLYVIVLAVLTTWLIWTLTNIPLKFMTRFLSLSIKSLLSIFLISIIVIECSGYHNLAIFMVQGVIMTFLIMTIAYSLMKLYDSIVSHLFLGGNTIATNIREHLDISHRNWFFELRFFYFSLFLIVTYYSILALLNTWGISDMTTDSFRDSITGKISFSGVTIYPARICYAIIAFASVFLVGRMVTAWVKRKYRTKYSKSSQVALTSLISYGIFILAAFVSLIVAGVNMTGFYVVAGALSVGIGLGLQDIVNNFFSGIVLLLEKQLKPMDRVIVGETEGFIKKINIRSTHVRTLNREDVIIPNSELISNQVRNYMMQDNLWRVSTQVGVAYGSDVDLVKDILLQVATDNTDILDEAPNAPRVLFLSFDSSSLLFELRGIISNPNMKNPIKSDLNFAIIKAFRDNNIEIAFPQCDIHVKQLPRGDDQDSQ